MSLPIIQLRSNFDHLNMIFTSDVSSESDLPDTDSVFGFNSGFDSGAGIDFDSGVIPEPIP